MVYPPTNTVSTRASETAVYMTSKPISIFSQESLASVIGFPATNERIGTTCDRAVKSRSRCSVPKVVTDVLCEQVGEGVGNFGGVGGLRSGRCLQGAVTGKYHQAVHERPADQRQLRGSRSRRPFIS